MLYIFKLFFHLLMALSAFIIIALINEYIKFYLKEKKNHPDDNI